MEKLQSNAQNYKNLISKILKENFTELRIGTRLNEGSGLTCSDKFIAYANDGGGGSASIITISSAGIRKPPKIMISGHSAGITDVKFSPFHTNFLATCSDDRTIKTWNLPMEGEFYEILEQDFLDSENMKRTDYIEKITMPYSSLHGHDKRVTLIEFNKNSDNILSSCSSDGRLFIWDLEKSLKICTYEESNNLCYDMKWNYFGSLISTTNKDRLVRIIDPRQEQTAHNFMAHEGTRIGKCTWLGGSGVIQNKLITTGFTQSGSRSIKLWDIRSTEMPIIDVQLDIMSSTLYPYFENEFKLLTVFGKGDGNIRVFRFDDKNEDSLIQVEEVRTTKPQRGICFLPVRCLDINKSEVIRIFKSVSTDTIDIISLSLPRKQHIYSEDIFPDCYAGIPSLDSDDWLKGVNRPPILVSLNPDIEKKPYLPKIEDYNEYNFQSTKKITSILRKPSSNKNIERENLYKKSSLKNELPLIEENKELIDKSSKPSSKVYNKKLSKQNSVLSRLSSLFSLSKKNSSSGIVSFEIKRTSTSNSTASNNNVNEVLHIEDHLFDSNSEVNSIHSSTESSYYCSNNKKGNYDNNNNYYLYNASSICKSIPYYKDRCGNVFENKEINYSDILDYRSECSGTNSSFEQANCNLNNFDIRDYTTNACNYDKSFQPKNSGFVKRMVDIINTNNILQNSCKVISAVDYPLNKATRLCKFEDSVQKSKSNCSIDDKESTISRSSTTDLELLSNNIIIGIRRDLDDANKRINQLDDAIKRKFTAYSKLKIRNSQEDGNSENKSAKILELKKELEKINMEYCDLNIAYRQQSALFGLYKEFYEEIEDILADSFRAMREVASNKK
ncbi:coronin like WD40 repeat protein [Cryptosporidium ryanae]|uniref:coronin like WD40 repeat protein n=1 Tax=Cryptosporidium ryanae TaxID=515981 RepID=UPI003519DCA3|nr:coronin like WD40 repeat protein [Cryptosporidium ryanae]